MKPCDGAAHYRTTRIEAIEVIEDWDLPHHLACVVKYLARYRLKHDDPRPDIRKARWYLDRYLAGLDEAEAKPDTVRLRKWVRDHWRVRR